MVQKDARIHNRCDLPENCLSKQELALSLFCSWRHMEVQIYTLYALGQMKGRRDTRRKMVTNEGLCVCLRTQTRWWM